jgi:hypothetical protein
MGLLTFTPDYTVSAIAVHDHASQLATPFPPTSTDLAYAEAKLVAAKIIDHHRHRRDLADPNHTCPKCVIISNLLIASKLRTQAADTQRPQQDTRTDRVLSL